MRVPSGSTDRKVPFVAVDSTDLKTRETGLASFTVYRSRDGGAATLYTTPTVAEASAANMPGLYWLTIDEDTTIAAGHDVEVYTVHITQASMAPVTLAIELYRPKATEGNTIVVDASGIADANVQEWLGTAVATPTVAGVPEVDVTHLGGDATSATDLKDFADAGYDPVTNKVQGVVLTDTVTTYTGNTVQTGDAFARLGAPAGASVSADVAAVKAQTAAIEVDTADIQTRLPATLSGGRMRSQVEAFDANAITAASLAADAGAEIAAAVWDEARAGHVAGGSFGEGVASVQGNVTGSVASVTGNVGGNVTGSVGSVAAGGITAASVATGAIDADAIATDAANEIADALLNRDMGAVSDTNARSPLNALRLLRNKSDVAAGTLTVKKEDDATTAWTAAVSTDAAANPIVGVDPA